MEHYKPLLKRAGELGANARRAIYNLEQHLPPLLLRLELDGRLEEVHLWKISPRLTDEFGTVAGLTGEPADHLADLGCFFSIQLLHLNLYSLDLLRFQVKTHQDKMCAYRDFLAHAGQGFEKLIGVYLERLADHFFAREKRPLYSFIAVGTPYNQGDLVLGVLDDGSPPRENLHRVLTRIKAEMLRRAPAIHFDASENVGKEIFSASLAEYQQLLDSQLQDFNLISDMLGNRLLIGSRNLHQSFHTYINKRYLYDQDRSCLHHEAFLRGILGEIRARRLRPYAKSEIHLYEDGLLLARCLATALRCVYRLETTSMPDLFDQLRKLDPGMARLFSELEEILVFLETFRLLNQLLVGEGDLIALFSPPDVERLRPIALSMGYQDSGPVKAHQKVLTHWQEKVELTRDLTDRLLPFLTSHLSRLKSGITMLTLPDEAEDDGGNLALDLAEVLAFQQGARYWDDLLLSLEEEDSPLLKKFVRDLGRLDAQERIKVLQEFAAWGKTTFYSIIRLLANLLQQGLRIGAPGLFAELSAIMFSNLEGTSNDKRRLTTVFRRFPQLVSPFLLSLPVEQLTQLEKLLAGEVFQEELIPWQKRILLLSQLSRKTSFYFKRYLKRVIQRCPQVASCIEAPLELHLMARGLLSDSEFTEFSSERKRLLGEFYEIEFLRSALETLAGARHFRIGREFARFTSDFVENLYDTCRRESSGQDPRNLHDQLAIFVAGGHARGQAYDDDYDIIVLLDSPNPADLDFANQILARMSRVMAKHGLIPHFRFADWSDGYVVTLKQLATRLESNEPDIYIDQSQLLEMQCLIGSPIFLEKLRKQVFKPHILDCSKTYIQAVKTDIESRREDFESSPPDAINIKEGPGGLRDLELAGLACRTAVGKLDGSIDESIQEMAISLPDMAPGLESLVATNNMLNHIRAGYRLTVAACNEINLDLLDETAIITGAPSGKDLALRLQQETRKAAEIIDQLLTLLIS